ncbi:hypothetical protein D9M69_00930 [compost metagenome]
MLRTRAAIREGLREALGASRVARPVVGDEGAHGRRAFDLARGDREVRRDAVSRQ